MVDPVCEKRFDQGCEYSLDALRRLAAFRQVNYMSRRVQRHVENLKYNLEDVCDRLCELSTTDFQHSERYHSEGPWNDVYLLAHPVTQDPKERLYIKFRLDDKCVYVELCSFHPENWL